METGTSTLETESLAAEGALVLDDFLEAADEDLLAERQRGATAAVFEAGGGLDGAAETEAIEARADERPELGGASRAAAQPDAAMELAAGGQPPRERFEPVAQSPHVARPTFETTGDRENDFVIDSEPDLPAVQEARENREARLGGNPEDVSEISHEKTPGHAP